jgi:HemY protein
MKWFSSFLRLAVLLGVVLWLMHEPGAARIEWRDYVVETSAALLVLVGFGLAVFLFMIYRLWRLIWDGPQFWSLRKKIKKLSRGHNDLAHGFTAIASGDGVEAGKFAVAARKVYGDTVLVRFLKAQAANLSGDRKAAKEIFLSLARENDGAVLGYRGLIVSALREGNWDEAERCVEKLYRLKPETPWLHLVRFELSARRERWGEADQSLLAAKRAKLVAPEVIGKRRAALLLARAMETTQGSDAVTDLAEQSIRFAPNWLPAVLLLASERAKAGHIRAASRLIEKAWAQNPHPDLAAQYGAMSKSAEDSLAAYRRIEYLTRLNPDATVSRFVLAEAAFDADLWGAARRHLLSVVSRPDATQGVYRLLAKLERRETGDERAVAQWLMRVTEALPDPRWICQKCGGSHQAWQANCLHCGSFDSLEWQIPGASRDKTAELPDLLAEIE